MISRDDHNLQIGLSAVQRLAIVQDPKWRGGWYYDAPDGDGSP